MIPRSDFDFSVLAAMANWYYTTARVRRGDDLARHALHMRMELYLVNYVTVMVLQHSTLHFISLFHLH